MASLTELNTEVADLCHLNPAPPMTNHPWHELADRVASQLPQPVQRESSDAGELLVAGEPSLVAVLVSEDGVVVSTAGKRWEGSYTLVPDYQQFGRLAWSDLPDAMAEKLEAVRTLVDLAIAVRRATFRTCRYCGRSVPPEFHHADDVCQGCAERQLGVVH